MDDETEVFEHAGFVCTVTRNVSEVSGAIAWNGWVYLPNGEEYVTPWCATRAEALKLVESNADAGVLYLEMQAQIK